MEIVAETQHFRKHPFQFIQDSSPQNAGVEGNQLAKWNNVSPTADCREVDFPY